jgi:hypothetical protein
VAADPLHPDGDLAAARRRVSDKKQPKDKEKASVDAGKSGKYGGLLLFSKGPFRQLGSRHFNRTEAEIKTCRHVLSSLSVMISACMIRTGNCMIGNSGNS